MSSKRSTGEFEIVSAQILTGFNVTHTGVGLKVTKLTRSTVLISLTFNSNGTGSVDGFFRTDSEVRTVLIETLTGSISVFRSTDQVRGSAKLISTFTASVIVTDLEI